MIWRTITENCPQYWLSDFDTLWCRVKQHEGYISFYKVALMMLLCPEKMLPCLSDRVSTVFPPFVMKGHGWPLVFFSAAFQSKGTYWSGHVLVIVQVFFHFHVFFCHSVSPLNQPHKGHSPYSPNTVLMRNVLNFQGLWHLKHSYISLMWTGW